MDDWRLRGQEDYLMDARLHPVTLPDFWLRSYEKKGPFYQKIRAYAENFVETMHRGQEYLVGEEVGRFWHEHCEFCWEKATTDAPGEFYCTGEDGSGYWICKACFKDFHEKFHWTVLEEIDV